MVFDRAEKAKMEEFEEMNPEVAEYVKMCVKAELYDLSKRVSSLEYSGDYD
jgi:hypothetical protein